MEVRGIVHAGLTVFLELGYIRNFVMGLSDRDLAGEIRLPFSRVPVCFGW